jgi:hypothetical protein
VSSDASAVLPDDDEYNVLDDPLGHLTADERQAAMASMSIGELKKVERDRLLNEQKRKKRESKSRA